MSADTSHTATADIPVVSLEAMHGNLEQRRALAHEITAICHNVGFLVVVDHGVPVRLLDDVFAAMDRFFALPEVDKSSIDKRNSPHFRGWETVGTEYTNNRPDIREQIDLWTEWDPRERDVEPFYLRLLGPNQWPPASVQEGLPELMSEWFTRMAEVASKLLGLLAIGLDLADDHFEKLFGHEPMSLTKLIHYPPTPPGAAGVNAHHDTGFLTVLAPGPTPGLQVEMPSGDWVDIPAVPGGLVINLGEMLQGLTGNYLLATPHRVITADERLAAGYFHGPSLDLALDPLPLAARYRDAVAASARHRGAGFMARREETESGVGDMRSSHHAATYGEQLWNYFARSYPHNMAAHHADLVAPAAGSPP